jgi:hypothetical protein
MIYDIMWYMIWYTIWYDTIMIWYDDIWYDIFNCNWVATRWQLFSTHVHTNNTENDTKQTIHRTTRKYIEQHIKYIEQHKKIHRATQQLGRARAVPRLCGFYPGICLATEQKARKTLSQGVYTGQHDRLICCHNIDRIHTDMHIKPYK